MSTSTTATTPKPARRGADTVALLERFGVLVFLVLLIAFFTFENPRFISPRNITNILMEVSIYAILGWTDLAPLQAEPLYYPATESERSELARAIFAIVEDAAARAAFNSDRDGYAARFDLGAGERAALVALDRDALRERLGVNPMLLYQLEARVKS